MVMITEAVALKVRDVVAAGLVHGVGVAEPGKMCVEAAVCYALGLPHGDDPGCVSAPLRRLKIKLNDSIWSSDQARASGLRRLALAQLGSRDHLDDKEFIRRVVDITIRRVVPAAMRLGAKATPLHADELQAAALRCETEGTRESCLAAKSIAAAAHAANAAAANAAAYAAHAAAAHAADAVNAAYAYAYVAADADDAADAATAAAAYAAAAYATSAYATAAAYDKSLAQFAEWVVEILIDMQAPGCQWLYLVPKETAGQ